MDRFHKGGRNGNVIFFRGFKKVEKSFVRQFCFSFSFLSHFE